MTSDRRGFLSATAALGLTGLVPVVSVRGEPPKPKEKPDEDIPASEDLMREHGVIRRVMVVYDESTRRLLAGEDVPPEAWHRTATLFRKFGEEYHEKLEETFVFPEFEKRNHALAALTRILRKQHTAGRAVTDLILRISTPEQFRQADSRKQLAEAVRAFNRMYQPHAAREDTDLFPELRKLVTPQQFKDLGERFEQEEHRLLGEEGYEKALAQVVEIEKHLGLDDLDKFTAAVPGR